MSKTPSICFVAHNAYGVLANIDTGHAGGVEVQIPLLARWFSKQGYTVSMITWDEGFEDGVEINGIRVYKLCHRHAGLPILRFFTPRWSSLMRAMKRANADVYFYSCGDLTLGQMTLWARRNARKLVYSIVNEADCKQSLEGQETLRERVLYRMGLKRSDAIITQTKRQQSLLQAEFGLNSTVIPMPSLGFNDGNESTVQYQPDSVQRVLWVGRFSEEKRLEWLLQAAERLPSYAFDVIGAPNMKSTYSDKLIEHAKRLQNVTLHGRVKHEQLKKYYQQATILCSTSIYEGFPNVFLESWSIGVPLVTTFDPDDVVKTYGLGKVVSSVDELVDAIQACCKQEAWQQLHCNSLDYFRNHHTVEHCLPLYQQVIDASISHTACYNQASQTNQI